MNKNLINGIMIGAIVNMTIAQCLNNLNMLIFWGCILVALAILKQKELKR